jgi:hypothetical protein
MELFIIPVTNVPQKFAISLAGKDYLLTCKWNAAEEAGWVLDIADGITNEIIACNIPLITGADCLSGLEYLGISGELIVYTDGNELAVPTLENLGIESNLYFRTEIVDQ